MVKTAERARASGRAHHDLALSRAVALGAIGAVLATYWCALAFVSRRGAVLAALMMVGFVMLAVEARLAKTDAVLLFTIVAAMGVLARAYLLPRKDDGRDPLGAMRLRWQLAGNFLDRARGRHSDQGAANRDDRRACCAALSILDARRAGSWRCVRCPASSGFSCWCCRGSSPSMRASATPFLVDVRRRRHAAPRSRERQETHGAPPGLLHSFVLRDVLSRFDAGAARPRPRSGRRAGRRRRRFLLAWLVPSWIVFELVVTKLPHYVLPLYPAIAILIAGAVETKVLSQRPWLVRGVDLVVPRPGGLQHCRRDRRRDRDRSRSRASPPGRSSPPRSCAACSPGGFTRTTAPSAAFMRATAPRS